MQIRFDGHVHTVHSPCAQPGATLERMASQTAAAGTQRWAVTDHLFTERNVPGLEAARRDLDALDHGGRAVFAVEASVLREWDVERTAEDGDIWGWHPGGPKGKLTMYLPEALVARLGIRFVLAGAHWPLGARMSRMAIVRDYHRQNMFLAEDPRVNVIAHPWWWRTKFTGACGVPVPFRWLEDFSTIPRSMHDEFAAAAREHGKLIEINASNMTTENYSPRWHEQYTEYLVGLKEAGCRFAMGGDSHSPDYRPRPQDMAAMLEAAGFTEDDFWTGPDA